MGSTRKLDDWHPLDTNCLCLPTWTGSCKPDHRSPPSHWRDAHELWVSRNVCVDLLEISHVGGVRRKLTFHLERFLNQLGANNACSPITFEICVPPPADNSLVKLRVLPSSVLSMDSWRWLITDGLGAHLPQNGGSRPFPAGASMGSDCWLYYCVFVGFRYR
jgi:hypothetical protein